MPTGRAVPWSNRRCAGFFPLDGWYGDDGNALDNPDNWHSRAMNVVDWYNEDIFIEDLWVNWRVIPQPGVEESIANGQGHVEDPYGVLNWNPFVDKRRSLKDYVSRTGTIFTPDKSIESWNYGAGLDLSVTGWINLAVSTDTLSLAGFTGYDIGFHSISGVTFSLTGPTVYYGDGPGLFASEGQGDVGGWHFVAAVYESGTDVMKLSVDNGPFKFRGGGGGNIFNFTIHTSGTAYLDGTVNPLDSWGFWQVPLHSGHVENLWNNGDGLGFGYFLESVADTLLYAYNDGPNINLYTHSSGTQVNPNVDGPDFMPLFIPGHISTSGDFTLYTHSSGTQVNPNVDGPEFVPLFIGGEAAPSSGLMSLWIQSAVTGSLSVYADNFYSPTLFIKAVGPQKSMPLYIHNDWPQASSTLVVWGSNLNHNYWDNEGAEIVSDTITVYINGS